LQKLCHDGMRSALGAEPVYFAAAAMPAGARLEPLCGWARTLTRVARHDEHPWNEGLLIESLIVEGRGCWQEATTRPPRGPRGLDTLGR
jgi:DNA polymerase-3 subunit delta'